jgi:hypothetical protein
MVRHIDDIEGEGIGGRFDGKGVNFAEIEV